MVIIRKIGELLKNGEVIEEIRDKSGKLVGSVYVNERTGEEEITGYTPTRGYEGEIVPLEVFTDNQREIFKKTIGYVPEEIQFSLIEGVYLYRDNKDKIRYLTKEDSQEINEIGRKENGFDGEEILKEYEEDINPPRCCDKNFIKDKE